MFVLALEVELRLPQSNSLKDKRQIMRHILDACRSRFGVSAAEVSFQDKYQRGGLGFAVVSSTPGKASEVIATVEDFIWSHPELEVISAVRNWLEPD